jgi:glycosyltransferase involved in cell wall biosynthesis
LEPNKGHALLLQALPFLHDRFPNARLLLAGDGPCRESLKALGEKLGITDAVEFLGEVDDLTLFYSALDAFLFPSTTEGLGSALLLAMAHGVPSVAFAGGSAKEIIENKHNGLLAETTDPEALAAATVHLLGDPDLAQQLSAKARETIEQKFTVNHMVENTLRVYHQAVKQETPA